MARRQQTKMSAHTRPAPAEPTCVLWRWRAAVQAEDAGQPRERRSLRRAAQVGRDRCTPVGYTSKRMLLDMTAAGHDEQPRSDSKRLGPIVSAPDYACPCRDALSNNRFHRRGRYCVESRGGFIEQKNARAQHQSTLAQGAASP